jgi:hypothetical protein
MFGQEPARVHTPSEPNAHPGAKELVSGTSCYQRPRLEYVGSVTRLVQSGPTGNRYETYRCSYWSDR